MRENYIRLSEWTPRHIRKVAEHLIEFPEAKRLAILSSYPKEERDRIVTDIVTLSRKDR
jgi:hypothetical protein